MILNHTGNLLTKEKAEILATDLNANDEDGWTYRAKHDPKGTGYSLVEIFDENGEFVGHA